MGLPSASGALWVVFCVVLPFVAWRVLRRCLRRSLDGKAVVVTGCDSGLGWAIAQRLAQDGAVVFACCLGPAGMQRCGCLRDLLGGRVLPVQVDITSDEDVARLLATVKEDLQKRGTTLLGLVNNAGLGNYGFCEALDLQRFKAVMEVNCLGTARVTKAFLALLRAHGPGARLVTIGSMSDRVPAGFGSAYVPTKAWACSFTECVGAEMRRFGIRASVIEPGFIATELLDAGTKGGAKASESADSDVRKVYGEFASMMRELRGSVELCEGLNGGKEGGGAWVADAVVDALSSVWPRSRYLVGYETFVLMLLPRIPGWTRLVGILCEHQHRAAHK